MSRTSVVKGARRPSPSTASRGSPPDSLAADILATFTLTISSVGFAISFAVLIFGGALESGMPRAIGSFVLGAGVMAVVIARRSNIVPVATMLQDGPAIVMAVVVADFAARESANVSDVFVLLVVTMLATALATALLGRFGLGDLGRCVPTSVVGAFVGGTGWLACKGGLDVMTSASVGLSDLGGLLDADVAKYWAPGLAIGVLGWLAGRSPSVPAHALGLLVVASIAGFHVVVAIASSVSAVESAGWLLGPFPEPSGTTLVTPREFTDANWAGIARSTPGIASVVGLACVGQLLHLTGIRTALVPRLDLDAELRTSAIGNLAAALFGMVPGLQGFGFTTLLNRMGATRRAVPVLSGVFVIVFGVVGIAAVGYVPRLIIGALLIMVGLALLDDWVHGLTRSVSAAEQILGAVIVAVVAWFGLLEGIAVGLVAACALFIVRYSRVDPIRAASDGHQLRSQADRPAHDVELLQAAGGRLCIFELQGFLFFGSLTTVEDRLRQQVLGSAPVETLVIDFANVTGVDGSGYDVIARLMHEVHSEGVAVWVSAIEPSARRALTACEPDLSKHVIFLRSLELALEIIEDQFLAPATDEVLEHKLRLDLDRLSPQLLAECAAHRFLPGTIVMAQGSNSKGLLIVQRGRLAASRRESDGSRTRLRRFGEFTVVGDIGSAADTPRKADVVAEGVVDGWWLSIDHYRTLQSTKPSLIFELHEFIVQVQAERLNALSQSLEHHMR